MLKKEEKHILIFGNDYTINDLDFNLVEKSDLITAGVNRIWKVYNCDYLYFLDAPIMTEILKTDVDLRPSKLMTVSCRYTYKNKKKWSQLGKRSNGLINCIKYDTINWPNSVNALIPALNFRVFRNYECFFYIYGVSLKWNEDKHHFWVGDEAVVSHSHTKEFYEERFGKFLKGLEYLSTRGINMVSCSKDSRLNEFFDYVDIHDVLSGKYRMKL